MSISSKDQHDYFPELLDKVIAKASSVLIGKEQEIRLALMSMLCGGHVLLEDVPGVGKTKLVRTLAACLGCSFNRIQFTYDLMPADITGTSVYSPHHGSFEFRAGPLMANVVLADEVNRASPRTQSALLEAMEERKVTVDGTTHRLPNLFLLLATQNPLHFEGTHRLPEAQLDRFFMRLRLGYPTPSKEFELLSAMEHGDPLEAIKPVLVAEEVLAIQRRVVSIHVDDVIKQMLVECADASRHHAKLQLGISPRGTLAWLAASKAAAYMNGRSYVIPDDVKEVAVPLLSHRLLLYPQAAIEGMTAEGIVTELLSRHRLPHVRSRKAAR